MHVVQSLYLTFSHLGIRGENGRSYDEFLMDKAALITSPDDHPMPDVIQIYHPDKQAVHDTFQEELAKRDIDETTARYASILFEAAWSIRQRVHDYMDVIDVGDEKQLGARATEDLFGFIPEGRVACIEQPYSISLEMDSYDDFVRAVNHKLLSNSQYPDHDESLFKRLRHANTTTGFNKKIRIGDTEIQVAVSFGRQSRRFEGDLNQALVTFIHEGVHAELTPIEYSEMTGDIEKYAEVAKILEWMTGKYSLDDDPVFAIGIRLRQLKARDMQGITQGDIERMDAIQDRLTAVRKVLRSPEALAKRKELAEVYVARLIDVAYRRARGELLAHTLSNEIAYAISPDGSYEGALEIAGGSYDYLNSELPMKMVRLAASLQYSILRPAGADTAISDDVVKALTIAADAERERYFQAVREAGDVLYTLLREGKMNVSALAVLDIRDWPEYFRDKKKPG